MPAVVSDAVRSADGTRIAFDRHGDGPAVVFVGGALQHCSIDSETARTAGLVAEAGPSVVHYDRRGRGESTDTAPYAVERELEDLHAIVAAVLFGMSSGGLLALEAAVAGGPMRRPAVYEPPTHTPSASPAIPS